MKMMMRLVAVKTVRKLARSSTAITSTAASRGMLGETPAGSMFWNVSLSRSHLKNGVLLSTVRKNIRKGAAKILHTNRKISAALEILKF